MSKSENRTPYLDGIRKQFLEESQKFYHGLEFSSSASISSGDQPYSCSYEYRFGNTFLKGSPYEFPSDTKLIHYIPSIDILFDVIKSGVFRLTSLNAKNDKHELSYLTKELKIDISADVIEKYKKEFFCASFGKVNPIKEEDFAMWRLYGSEGRGAALIFEVENNSDDWHNFTIGQVKYGLDEASKRYRDYVNFFNDFQKQNNSPIQNRPITYTAFLALHKNTGWQYENEVRLLSHYSYNEYTLDESNRSSLLTDVYHSYNNYHGHYAYLELPLIGSYKYKKIEDPYSTENMKHLKEVIDKMLPHLKLVKVILGYQYSTDNYFDIKKIIDHEANKHPSLKFDITTSEFSDHG